MVSVAKRIASIDLFRIPAIFAVICIHTKPFGAMENTSSLYNWLCFTITQSTRFAVPFFFMASGYLFGLKVQSGGSNANFYKYVKRLFSIFSFWTVAYIFVPTEPDLLTKYGFAGWYVRMVYWNLEWIVRNPIDFIFRGSRGPLWYLVSLGISLSIINFWPARATKSWSLLIFSCVLYICGVLGRSYANTPIGYHISFNMRYGPFISTLFVVIGWKLSFNNNSINNRIAIIVTIFGVLLHFSEAFVLWRFFGTGLRSDYLFGTVFLSTGLMLLLVGHKEMGENTLIARIGMYTLGIYVSHPLFVSLLRPLGRNYTVYWEILFPIIVFCLSLIFTIALAKNHKMRRFVV